MEIAIYKNPLALRFVRCVSKIPKANQNAGGAGFTLGQAMKKLESELIERDFHLNELLPRGIRPEGIAAHLTEKLARNNALQEIVESSCLKQIHNDLRMSCIFRFSVFGITLGIARTSYGYFALIRGNLNGKPVAAHSASKGFISAWIKAWEEFQSILFFKPKAERLKAFTKANQIFSEADLKHLKFSFDFRSRYALDLAKYQEQAVKRKSRVIVYFCKT